MTNAQNKLTIVGEQDGTYLSIVGGNYRIVILGEQTGGAYAVIDMHVPPGGGPGPHAHPDFQESFHVLEGEVEVKTERETFTARQGSFVNIPKGGIIHSFRNKTDKVARLWCVVVPAGEDAFFQEIGQPVQAGEFLPAPAMGPQEQQRLQQIARKHGQTLYPPDYLG
jgi:quercetin dioxygenase-like cupin family protein